MFGLWFLDSNLNFSSLTARITALIIGIIFILPMREISHIWLSHVFSGIKFKFKSYPFFDFFDPIGALSMLFFKYGWAKKVPYFVTEPDNRSEYIFVYLAGTAFTFFSGIILGIIFNIIGLLILTYKLHLSWFANVTEFLIEINVVLTVVNLLPIPPLDGFKICEAFIPGRYLEKYKRNYFLISTILFIMLLFGFFDIPLQIMGNAVYKSMKMIAGIPFVLFRLKN